VEESTGNGDSGESASIKQVRAVGAFPRMSLKKAQELVAAI
jgi:hypothetical protein